MSDTKSAGSSDLNIANNKRYVKYMVSLRCKMFVKSELDNLDLDYKITSHGAIEFVDEITDAEYEHLKNNLLKSGLVLLNDSESMLIDKIINTIIETIHYTDELPKMKFSDIINEHAVVREESILKIFSDVKGMSILQFIVVQKIERAKELLLYEDIPLPEIAEILNYKNEHYLVAQFKKITGLTPSDFKRVKNKRMEIVEQHSNSAHSEAAGVNH